MLEGSIEYAHRYAALASEKAAAEKDPIRKAELEEIARVCMRVPEYPAETFQEALQSFYFGILMIFYDTRTYGMGFGRVDQFLYPCFQSDIETGYIDEEYATQLLECFRCKVMGKRQFWPDLMTPNLSSESHFHIAIGNPLMLSPDFPPLYTVHETFTSYGVPSIPMYLSFY